MSNDTSEMIERVAHSLSLANQSPDVLIGDNWDIPGLVNKDGYRKLARAAIAAMREPTLVTDLREVAAVCRGVAQRFRTIRLGVYDDIAERNEGRANSLEQAADILEANAEG